MISKPKVVAPKQKDPPIFRNPYLDGVEPLIRARSTGLRSLRIDKGSEPAPAPTAPVPTTPVPTTPATPAPTTGNGKFNEEQLTRMRRFATLPGMLGLLGRAMLKKNGYSLDS